MAAGGVVIAGETGDPHLVDGRNALVLDTLDPGEMVGRLELLAGAAAISRRLRRAARATARRHAWQTVATVLIEQVEEQMRRQRLLRS
jgi:glycosyltransferase involved in cell wall biosynthesis